MVATRMSGELKRKENQRRESLNSVNQHASWAAPSLNDIYTGLAQSSTAKAERSELRLEGGTAYS